MNIESLLYRNFRDFHPKLLNCKRPGVLYRSLSYHFPDNVVGSDHSGAPDCGLFGTSGSSSVQANPSLGNSLMSNNSILAAAAAASAASNYQAEAARQFLQQLSASQALNPPSQVDLRESSAVNSELGVWATETIPQGTRFGPFMGKWTMEPTHQKFAWEVSKLKNFHFAEAEFLN